MNSFPPSEQFTTILAELESGSAHLFITGRAGTGKSTLLQQFRLQTKIPLVVLAPTGVAAVHIGGETIHSFFGFAPNVTVKEARSEAFFTEDRALYKELEMIIIDEISMVRSDLLDCIDTFLQIVRGDTRAFGGVRLVCFGDLYQLPPVVTGGERETFRTLYPSEWFFDAKVIRELLSRSDNDFVMYELDTIYRQNDQAFIDLLEAVRLREVRSTHLDMLNACVGRADLAIVPPITLTSRRDTAERINAEHLAKLPGREKLYSAKHTGSFPNGHLPTRDDLALKAGARVMFVANDPEGKFVNGTLGTIRVLSTDSVTVAIDGGGVEEIEPHTWELSHTVLSKDQELEKEKIGEFTQLPLMLAWAVTIHKSQGKTFDRVVIDLGLGAFAHGQVYVALSRCRTLSGITLTQPIRESDIRMNWRVGQFLTAFVMRRADREQSREEKYQRIQDAIEMGTAISLTYLEESGKVTIQKITPEKIAEMTEKGRRIVGVQGIKAEDNSTLLLNAEHIMKVI